MFKNTIFASVAATALAASAVSAGPARAAGETKIIELTQTACQFVEVEGTDHGYASSSKADCEKINESSGAERLAKSETLKLTPGSYVFRVTNKNVPYDLGFWLRGDGLLNRATLPSVSGGGLSEGATKDYEVTLTAGVYFFSCPHNPPLYYMLGVAG